LSIDLSEILLKIVFVLSLIFALIIFFLSGFNFFIGVGVVDGRPAHNIFVISAKERWLVHRCYILNRLRLPKILIFIILPSIISAQLIKFKSKYVSWIVDYCHSLFLLKLV